MKNFKTVSDSQLLDQVRLDAAQERKSGLAVIHQLREIRLRRLDAQLGYSSLHKFCMEELKYSPGSAWRRIKAMEALQEMPELEARIEHGQLTLANVSQVQSFCAQQGKSLEEKKEILDQASHLSKRETEKLLATIAPLPERPEKVRPLDPLKSELRLTLDAEVLTDLDKIKDLVSHSHPGASYAEVISYLAKLGLKKLDPAAEKKPVKSRPPGENSTLIPAATRRAVWKRDGGRCGYVSPESGKHCHSTTFIQIDHAIPRAKGGGNELGNLRLRCQAHNLLAAVREFGEDLISQSRDKLRDKHS